MPEYYRPKLKQESRRMLRAAAPNIYLATLISLLLNYLPRLIAERGLYTQLLSAGSFDRMREIYEAWSLQNSGLGLQLATIAMNLFLTVVSFGFALYCLHASRAEQTGGIPTLFSGFAQFWRVLSVYILMGILIFLWSLLLIVPGIIKACAYSQAPYILMDNPDMTAMECISTSSRLMQGYKGEWLLLQLSFIGWEILAAFTFGILQIWLQPYIGIANAGFYNGVSRWQPASAEQAEPDRPRVDEYWKN